jgi:pyrroline-5-carboxylate reductase
MKENIGIIGFGNMGSLIAQQLKNNYQIFVFDKDINKTTGLSGINVCRDNIDLVRQVEVIILAVKPQDFALVLNEIKAGIKRQLIISIAAGITTGYIEKILGQVNVVRAMPNMPAKIVRGISCLSQGKFASPHDFTFAENLFAYLGKTLEVKEEMMNAATVISGSGPAYVCNYIITESVNINNIPEQKRQDFLNTFQKAAESLGFTRADAAFLVENTYAGTIDFLKKTDISPQELKKQVASRGGTTEAALAVLNKGGTLKEAIKAAENKAQELSKEE